MLSKFLQFVKKYQNDIILVIGVILISLLSFAVGYITAKQKEKEPIKFEKRNINIRIYTNNTNRFIDLFVYL